MTFALYLQELVIDQFLVLRGVLLRNLLKTEFNFYITLNLVSVRVMRTTEKLFLCSIDKFKIEHLQYFHGILIL